MTPIIYVTRNGLLEPLGQSQVLAYLRGLSRHYQITLISYEKPEDAADAASMARVQAECVEHGIRWLPQRFRAGPRYLAPAASMVRMVWLVARETRRTGARLVHARSYIPAAVALLAGRFTGAPFIFDMRALWPEELITAGRLRRGSLVHRAIAWAERVCLRRAAGVVSLTNAAVEHLREIYPNELRSQRLVVIPTCADLERFTPAVARTSGPRIHGCIGTVLSGWFRIDWLTAWIAAAVARDPEARLEILTRDNVERVRAAIDPDGRLGERLSIGSRRPQAMPEAVRGHDLSVMFYAGGEVSELGRSPTRMAEVLGSGLPVVANAGVGDVARIIREFQVGVLVEGPEQRHMDAALDELETLLADPGLAARCRAAAEAVFSLAAGVAAYLSLYDAILNERTEQPPVNRPPSRSTVSALTESTRR